MTFWLKARKLSSDESIDAASTSRSSRNDRRRGQQKVSKGFAWKIHGNHGSVPSVH